jgi:hypothetical protein
VTSSDHEVIEWEFQGSDNGVDQVYLIRRWSLTPLMGSDHEMLAKRMAAKAEWLTRMAAYPHLDDTSNREDLKAEA